MLSENEGDGELGGSVIELIKLGPLSILFRSRGWRCEKKRFKEVKPKESKVFVCVCVHVTGGRIEDFNTHG